VAGLAVESRGNQIAAGQHFARCFGKGAFIDIGQRQGLDIEQESEQHGEQQAERRGEKAGEQPVQGQQGPGAGFVEGRHGRQGHGATISGADERPVTPRFLPG